MAEPAQAEQTSARQTYSAHLDTLTALITYLALTHHQSRTARGLSVALGLPEDEIQETFDQCRAIFRRREDSTGKAFYTLHARFALRPYDNAQDDEMPEVRPNVLEVLLTFVTQQAREERESARFAAELASTEATATRAALNAKRATVVAAVAAVFALAGAILSALTGS